MMANAKGYRRLLTLAMKYRVRLDGNKATCLHCGATEELKHFNYPMNDHIKKHVDMDEITEKNVMGQ